MAKKPIRVGKVKRKSNIFYGVRLLFIKDKKNLSMKKKVQVIVHFSTVIIGYLVFLILKSILLQGLHRLFVDYHK